MIGVYKVVNNVTGGVYIGKTVHLEFRFAEHLLSLKKGKHENPLLQNTYNKHGEDAFSYEIIEETQTEKEADGREIYWIKWYRENGFEVYNVTDGGTGGDTWKNMSPERRAELRIKGRRPASEQAKLNRAEGLKRKWADPVFRERMILVRKGQKRIRRDALRKKIILLQQSGDTLFAERLNVLYLLLQIKDKKQNRTYKRRVN